MNGLTHGLLKAPVCSIKEVPRRKLEVMKEKQIGLKRRNLNIFVPCEINLKIVRADICGRGGERREEI